MQIRIADLPPEGIAVDHHIDPGQLGELVALQEAQTCFFKGPLAVNIRVMPYAGMYRMEGRLEGEVTMACTRCLVPTDYPLRSFFRLTFTRMFPGEEVEQPAEDRELQAEELGLVLFEGDAVDLRHVLQEQAILALPMQPLCREECRGLCAHCGADLNEGPCACEENDIDPRLAILKNWKPDA